MPVGAHGCERTHFTIWITLLKPTESCYCFHNKRPFFWLQKHEPKWEPESAVKVGEVNEQCLTRAGTRRPPQCDLGRVSGPSARVMVMPVCSPDHSVSKSGLTVEQGGGAGERGVFVWKAA